jgi:hypothetical protein
MYKVFLAYLLVSFTLIEKVLNLLETYFLCGISNNFISTEINML